MASFSTFREPYTAFPSTSPALTPTTLHGKWWVTTSTLPMWTTSKNINITYTPITNKPNTLLDVVGFSDRKAPPQTIDAENPENATPAPAVKHIRGVDTPLTGDVKDLQYKWRGKGWLMIASSKWQVIGYGGRNVKLPTEGETAGGEGPLEGVEWVITYFEKSMFTPPGVDIMCLSKEGVDEETLKAIKEGLEGCGDIVKGLTPQLLDVPRDPLAE